MKGSEHFKLHRAAISREHDEQMAFSSLCTYVCELNGRSQPFMRLFLTTSGKKIVKFPPLWCSVVPPLAMYVHPFFKKHVNDRRIQASLNSIIWEREKYHLDVGVYDGDYYWIQFQFYNTFYNFYSYGCQSSNSRISVCFVAIERDQMEFVLASCKYTALSWN